MRRTTRRIKYLPIISIDNREAAQGHFRNVIPAFVGGNHWDLDDLKKSIKSARRRLGLTTSRVTDLTASAQRSPRSDG